MSVIFDVFSAIGNFLGSVIDTVSYLMQFISTLINDFTDLLSVTPAAFQTIIATFAITSIVIACKRLIL